MQRLRDRLHLVYGFGHFGKSLMWNLSMLYFAFYLTEVAGIPTRAMGWVMAVSLVFNAICDLMIGRWLSRFVHDATAAARLQFKGSLLAGTAFVVFAMTGFLPEELRIGFSLLSLLLFRSGYSLMDVPQNSFMAFVASTDRERSRLASTRYIAAGLSALFITAAVTPLVQITDRDGQARVFLLLAWAVSPLTMVGGWLLHAVFRDQQQASASTEAATQNTPIRTISGGSADTFPLLLICILCFSGLASFFNKLESYLTAYVLEASLAASLFMPMIALGQVMGQLVWPHIADNYGMPRMLIFACIGLLLSTSGLWLAILHMPLAVIPTGFLYGAMAGGVLMAIWSMLAQTCTDVPKRTAWRYGLFTFCSKIAQAAAILTIGEWLSRVDYRGGSAIDNPLVTLGMVAPIASSILIGLVAIMIGNWRASGATERPATQDK